MVICLIFVNFSLYPTPIFSASKKWSIPGFFFIVPAKVETAPGSLGDNFLDTHGAFVHKKRTGRRLTACKAADTLFADVAGFGTATRQERVNIVFGSRMSSGKCSRINELKEERLCV
jgi:hypothetical protein